MKSNLSIFESHYNPSRNLLGQLWKDQSYSKLTIKTPKNVIGVVLVSLFWAVNIFRTLFWCFHCWLWTSKYQLAYIFLYGLYLPIVSHRVSKPIYLPLFFFTKTKMSRKYKNQLFENSVGVFDTVKADSYRYTCCSCLSIWFYTIAYLLQSSSVFFFIIIF